MDFTKGLRSAGAFVWCWGFFFSVFDALGMNLFGWHVPLCYAFFGLAGFFCFWAEKREYSTRVALYRIHDLGIYSSWRFLLLYFLWINLFAPFTSTPLKSILYALAGWCNLVLIGFSAQFLFSELRPGRSAMLLRDRLQILFWTFVGSSLLGILFWFANQWNPAISLPMRDEANFFLCIMMGLPFVLWDLLLRGRALLPRWVSAFVMVFMVGALVVADRKVFWLGIILSFLFLMGLRIYKRMRLAASIGLFAAAAAMGIFFTWLARYTTWLEVQKETLLQRFSVSLGEAARVALEHRLLGTGIAISGNTNGIWAQVLAEIGLMGFLFYLGFLVNLLWDLYRVGREPRIVVSNVALVSVLVFLCSVSHFFSNAYTPTLWVWYALWALLASSSVKKGAVL